MLAKGTILNNHWRVEGYLGEGACAKVYTVSSIGKEIAYDVVVKVIPTGNGTKSKKDKEQEKLCNTLYYEYVLYTGLLSDFPYRAQLPPRFSGVDEDKKLRYLVMEKFDYDLKQFAKSGDISNHLVADFGLQLLKGLQWLHQKGFIFVDVKPDNFMVKDQKVYFVDCKEIFSFSFLYLDFLSVGLVERIGVTPAGAVREMVGTPTYCSLNVNQGKEPHTKDDLEALGYVLLSIYNSGELPWEHTSSDNELLRMKSFLDMKAFSSTLGCDEVC